VPDVGSAEERRPVVLLAAMCGLAVLAVVALGPVTWTALAFRPWGRDCGVGVGPGFLLLLWLQGRQLLRSDGPTEAG
jgi:hypothetical protein